MINMQINKVYTDCDYIYFSYSNCPRIICVTKKLMTFILKTNR